MVPCHHAVTQDQGDSSCLESSPARRAHQPGDLVRRLLGLLLLVLALGLGLPASPASAHAELLSTDPVEGAVLATAPSSVELTFDEPVFLVPDGFQLYDGSGGHRTVFAEAVDATVRATLPPTSPTVATYCFGGSSPTIPTPSQGCCRSQ